MAVGALHLRLHLDGDAALRSLGSLGAVLALADPGDDFELVPDGLDCRFGGTSVWRLARLAAEPGVIAWRIMPMPGLCLLVTAVLRQVPGAKVEWVQGWPVMTPPDPRDDGDDEDAPAPDPAPRRLEPVG